MSSRDKSGYRLPRISGALQVVGANHRGTMEKTAEKAVRIRFEGAYDIPALRAASLGE